jgi:hypothetical protein
LDFGIVEVYWLFWYDWVALKVNCGIDFEGLEVLQKNNCGGTGLRLALVLNPDRQLSTLKRKGTFLIQANKMLTFMDYIQTAFHTSSQWNQDNSYSFLTATAQCNPRLVPFHLPHLTGIANSTP